jgi:hypothetical protein
MSSHNGDKSRYQITRKRGVLRRAKIRKLIADARRTGAPTAAPRAAKSPK